MEAYNLNPCSFTITSHFNQFKLFDDNLHHGRFLFRHKGKKRKGKPNYPPTKLLVKTGRKWRKADRGSTLRHRDERRRVRREWTAALQAQTQRRREQRAIDGSENVVQLFVDRHSRIFPTHRGNDFG